MYDKNTDKNLLEAAAHATLGAGIVTSFAVSQGQHPLIAVGITLFAALIAVACRRSGLI